MSDHHREDSHREDSRREDTRARIRRLMLRAELQRQAIGAVTDDYRRLTAPFDNNAVRLGKLVTRHPLLTGAGFALGGVLLWRRRGKLSGLIRGALTGISLVKALRGRR